MDKQDILDYLDAEVHPIVSPDRYDIYSNLHDMVGELPTAPQWIPISEQMPPANTEVLATSSGYVTIAEWCGGDAWFIQEGNSNATTEEIEAWMPLPKPYKG